ncbi:cyclophilin-like domain-containing protein [Lipomyces oligophaga]|uniref:cyclophilin-like domain-containing protein n=1 Tax=Lipomyces oligophaga TaxID=45792 RepID=UPI0034CDC975
MSPLPRVFLAFDGAKVKGNLIIELFSDQVPRTCENFERLCTNKQPEPSYQGSSFHRVVVNPDYIIQGGDITNGDGTGGISIYGEFFADEKLGWRPIDERGLVCMANKGPDTNSSQFFITLVPCPDLEKSHYVFGRVIPQSFPVLDMFSDVRTDIENDDIPLQADLPVISQCGRMIFKKKAKPKLETENHGNLTVSAVEDASNSFKKSTREPERQRERHHQDKHRHGSPSLNQFGSGREDGLSRQPYEFERHHRVGRANDSLKSDRSRLSSRRTDHYPKQQREQEREREREPFRMTDRYIPRYDDIVSPTGSSKIKYKGRGKMKFRENY